MPPTSASLAMPAASPETPNLFVARQPILDRQGRIHAYELLFRSGFENLYRSGDDDASSRQTIGTGVMGFGLDALVGDALAFVNVTREVLLSESIHLLPPERVVVEIVESVEADDAVVAACRDLWEEGYRFALDDWEGPGDREALLPFAHVVKLDVLGADARRLDALAEIGRAAGKPFLAERVETKAMYRETVERGFTLFQGFYFCEPEIVSGRVLEPNQATKLRLLQLVANEDIDFDEVEGVIRQDVALPVTLLRLLNSASFGWRREVTSIGQALRILGERMVRRWTMMVTMMGLGDEHPPELLNLSLLRAHFCEAIAEKASPVGRPFDAFLVGLLSNLDALTGRPLDEVVGRLSLPTEVEDALLRQVGPLADVAGYARAWERGEWEAVSRLGMEAGIRGEEVPALYAEAAARAREILRA